MPEQEQITEWFTHEFWPVYPSKFCRNGKGSRQKALNAMLKIKPGAEERRRILSNLKAQVRADKGNPNRIYWSIGTTYVNNMMWEDEIESQDEDVPRETNFCHCGEPTIGPRYKVCPKHLESSAERLKMTQILKELGLLTQGQSLQELSKNCREYLQKNGAYGELLNTMTSSLKPAKPGSR